MKIRPFGIRPLSAAVLLVVVAACSAPAPRGPSAAPTLGGSALIAESCSAPIDEAVEGHQHGEGAQMINAFVGLAREDVEPRGFAVGLDYEYRLSERWGVGGFAETVDGEGRTFVGGAQAFLHATDALVLIAGTGRERKDEHWGTILRVGAFYEIPLSDGWVISPAASYDFSLEDSEEDVLGLGVNLGYGW